MARSRRRTELARRVLVAALTIAAAGSAKPRSEAEQLFYEARTLLDDKEYDSACAKLEQSQRLDPGLGTLALLAYCHEMQGRTATAHAEYEQAVELARRVGDRERLAAIEERRDRLTPRLATLRLRVEEPVPGLEIVRAGKLVPRSEWAERQALDPGKVTIEARAPGHEPWTTTVDLADSAQIELGVPKLATTAASEPAAAATRFDPPVLVALGIGAAGLGVGTYFGLHAKSLNDDSDAHCDSASRCDQAGFDLRNDARSSARAANIAFGIGAAGIATAVVLLLVRGGQNESETPATVRVEAVPRGAWAAFERSF